MFSIIILSGLLLGYVSLLVCKYRHHNNYKFEAVIGSVQAILWCIIAGNYWQGRMTTTWGKCIGIMAIVIAVLSIAQGIEAIQKSREKNKRKSGS